MVGVSIVYSLESKRPVVEKHFKIMLAALRRALILILLGLIIFFIYHPGFTQLRFPGVLQRIGVVYFISILLYLKTSQRTLGWLLAIILVSYYLMMTFIPIPDGNPPNLTPEHNLAAWIDRFFFSTNHLSPFTKQWDPVGLLTTWPAIGSALFGIRIGSLLKKKDPDINKKCIRLLMIGTAAILLGLLAGLFFPINKSLWTSSYVLFAGGIGTVGITLAFWIIDVKGYKKYAWVLVVFGTNAISAYVLSEVLPWFLDFIKLPHDGHCISSMKYFYQAVFLPLFSPTTASLFSAIVFVVFIWLIMYALYKKRVIIKI